MTEYKAFRKAVPVWAENEERTMNLSCVFLATFKTKKEFVLRITASCFYRAFLNGKLIAYGPARAAHDIYRVDEITASGYENGAENHLLIEVAGYNCRSYYALNQPSFLQAEVDSDGEILFATDKTVECRILTERYRKVARFSFQRAFTESYSFNLPPQEFAFGKDFGKKTEVCECAQKTLAKREVPMPVFKCEKYDFKEKGVFFKETDELFPKVRYLDNEDILLYNYDELEVRPFDEVYGFGYKKDENQVFGGELKSGEYALFEYPVSLTGFILTELEAKTDAEIFIVFEEVDNRTDKADNQPIRLDFWRNDTLNIISYKLKKGEFKHFSFEPYTAKYIKVLVKTGEVIIDNVGLVRYENPETEGLVFKCEDERLNVVVEAARNTLAQNAVDLLTDCPSRERAGWLCDSYFSAQAEKLFTGENKIEKSFLDNYAYQSKNLGVEEGVLAMCYPADFGDGVFIPNWMLFYIIELYDCLKRTGDRATIENGKANVVGILDYFKQFENEYGLLENLKNWVFVEWSAASDDEYLKGVNFPTNMLYAYALNCAGELYGKSEYTEKAEKLKAIIRKMSFNGSFFEDNVVRENGALIKLGHTSETCQYYAFYFGIADEKDYPELYNTLIEKFGSTRDSDKVYPTVAKSNAFIGNILRSDYLVKKGLGGQFISEIYDSYYRMACTTGTLWEYNQIHCSLNHGFGSYVANMIVLAVSGYYYVNEEQKTVMVRNETTDLKYEIKVPTKSGYITIENVDGKRKIDVPEGYAIVPFKN